MATISAPDDLYAFRTALQSATYVRTSSRFDDDVIRGISRPASWLQTFASQLQIFAPAVACGALMMMVITHVAFLTPNVDVPITSDLGTTKTVNVNKLMFLMDHQGSCVASLTLIRESLENDQVMAPASARVERRLQISSAYNSTPNLV